MGDYKIGLKEYRRRYYRRNRNKYSYYGCKGDRFKQKGLLIICCSCGKSFWWKENRVKRIIAGKVGKWFLTAECPNCGVKLKDSNKIPENNFNLIY